MTVKLSTEIGQNFCYAPWTNIHINTTGTFKTCCAGTSEIGDLRQIPIQDLLADKKLIAIKKDLSTNSVNNNCQICARQELHSSVSERNWYNSIADNQAIELLNIDSFHLQNLDIRWSNTCNLSCVYCDHEASSQWANLKKIPVERLDYSNTLAGILEFIDTHKTTLKNLALLGGEPLLQKENESLLDSINNDVSINVITNLSIPLQSNKIFHKLLEKNKVMWDISFETVEDKYEYVRHGSSWELITKNIKYLKECVKDKPNHSVGITAQYSVYNALNLSDIHEYFHSNRFPRVRWSELHYPRILSVEYLPHNYIDKAINQLQKSVDYHNDMPVQKKFMIDMISSLTSKKSPTVNCQELLDWHALQEKTYWPNFPLKFSNLWPEYE